MLTNPLIEAVRNQAFGWDGPLLAVLDDFEARLQSLGSDPPETQPGNGGDEDEDEDESGSKSDSGSVQE